MPGPGRRPRRSCCARSATARPTASCTSTPRTAAGSARSPRACAARAAASAAASSRSSALHLVLHEGRSDLLTVTSAETRRARTRACASDGRALDAAARACDAVARLFDDAGAASRRLPPALQRARAARRASPAQAPGHANQLAFRLKLLLAAGLAPQLGACASCGEREHLSGFSGAAGGVVCRACEASAFAARRGGARVPGRRARPAAGRGAGPTSRARAAPGRARDRRDGRASRARPAAPGQSPVRIAAS